MGLRTKSTVTSTTPSTPLGDAGRDATADLLGQNVDVVLGPEFDRIVHTTFALDAATVNADYALVELAIQPLGRARDIASILDALDKSQTATRTAHRLLVNAQLVYEKVKTEIDSAKGALREAATKSLIDQGDDEPDATADCGKKKKDSSRRKAITNGDVDAEMHRLYPRDMAAYRERLAKAKGTVDHLEAMTDIVRSRTRSLEVMASASR